MIKYAKVLTVRYYLLQQAMKSILLMGYSFADWDICRKLTKHKLLLNKTGQASVMAAKISRYLIQEV